MEWELFDNMTRKFLLLGLVVLLFAGMGAAAPADSQGALHYRLNETTGSTASDWSPPFQDGTFNGNLPRTISGVQKSSGNWDTGVGQDFQNNTNENIGTSAKFTGNGYAFSMWLNHRDVQESSFRARDTLWDARNYGAQGGRIHFLSSPEVCAAEDTFAMFDGSSNVCSGYVVPNQLVLLTFEYDDGSDTYFIWENTTLQASVNVADMSSGTDSDAEIGNADGGGSPLSGMVDEFHFYNGTDVANGNLSDTQISNLHQYNQLTAANNAPVIDSNTTRPAPGNVQLNDNVGGEVNASDPDGDTLDAWMNVWEGATKIVDNQAMNPATGTNNFDLDNAFTADQLDTEYNTSFTVGDGSLNTSTSSNISFTLTNAAPEVENLTASPDPVEVGNTVNLTWEVNDPNGDTITWSTINFTAPNGTQTVENSSGTSFSDNDFFYEYIIPSDFGSIGQWQANVTASDGIVKGENGTFFTAEENTPPTWKNLKDNSTGTTTSANPIEISAEWRDKISGLNNSKLGINDSGSFVNASNIYNSPLNFSEISLKEEDGDIDEYRTNSTFGSVSIANSPVVLGSVFSVELEAGTPGFVRGRSTANFSLTNRSPENLRLAMGGANMYNSEFGIYNQNATPVINENLGSRTDSVTDSIARDVDTTKLKTFELSIDWDNNEYNVTYDNSLLAQDVRFINNASNFNLIRFYAEAPQERFFYYDTLEFPNNDTAIYHYRNISFSGKLGYRIWANDRENNWNVTDTATLNINEPDPPKFFNETPENNSKISFAENDVRHNLTVNYSIDGTLDFFFNGSIIGAAQQSFSSPQTVFGHIVNDLSPSNYNWTLQLTDDADRKYNSSIYNYSVQPPTANFTLIQPADKKKFISQNPIEVTLLGKIEMPDKNGTGSIVVDGQTIETGNVNVGGTLRLNETEEFGLGTYKWWLEFQADSSSDVSKSVSRTFTIGETNDWFLKLWHDLTDLATEIFNFDFLQDGEKAFIGLIIIVLVGITMGILTGSGGASAVAIAGTGLALSAVGLWPEWVALVFIVLSGVILGYILFMGGGS